MTVEYSNLSDAFLPHLQLGDLRRERRFGAMLEQLIAKPAGCVSQVFDQAKARLAAYRFLESDHFGHQDILDGIVHTVAATIQAYRHSHIIVPLDKSAIPIPSTPVDIRHLIAGRYNPGFWSLNAIALDAAHHQPIGLLWQTLFERPEQKLSQQMTKAQRRARPWSEKESYLWKVVIEHCLNVLRAHCSPMPHVLFVIDAEGDIASLLQWVQSQPGCDLLVRMAVKNRKEIFHGEEIAQILRQQYADAEYHLYLPRQKRTARIEVGFGPISYDYFKVMPKDWRKKLGTLNLWGIVASETDVPDDGEAVEWLLVTTQDIETIDEALDQLRHYNGRWIIERFHHGLKQVLKVSDTQLASKNALKIWIHMQSQAAMEIERVMRLSRTSPQTKAITEVSREAVYVVMTMQSQAPEPFKERSLESVTLKEFVVWLAQLGGYMKRKRGNPGHITISRGWARVSLTVAAFERGALPRPEQM